MIVTQGDYIYMILIINISGDPSLARDWGCEPEAQ